MLRWLLSDQPMLVLSVQRRVRAVFSQSRCLQSVSHIADSPLWSSPYRSNSNVNSTSAKHAEFFSFSILSFLHPILHEVKQCGVEKRLMNKKVCEVFGWKFYRSPGKSDGINHIFQIAGNFLFGLRESCILFRWSVWLLGVARYFTADISNRLEQLWRAV